MTKAPKIERSKIDGDRYLRGGFCWAKISGKRGKWAVALGWKSNHVATYIRETPTLFHATAIAEGWIKDHG